MFKNVEINPYIKMSRGEAEQSKVRLMLRMRKCSVEEGALDADAQIEYDFKGKERQRLLFVSKRSAHHFS